MDKEGSQWWKITGLSNDRVVYVFESTFQEAVAAGGAYLDATPAAESEVMDWFFTQQQVGDAV